MIMPEVRTMVAGKKADRDSQRRSVYRFPSLIRATAGEGGWPSIGT